MAVVIRLARHGSTHKPFYRVVAADQRFCKEGRHLEILGTYDPQANQNGLKLDKERVDYWISNGAQPSPTVKNLIKKAS